MDEIDETERQREAGGQQTDGGLLVAHAQDHFMMATLAQELSLIHILRSELWQSAETASRRACR